MYLFLPRKTVKIIMTQPKTVPSINATANGYSGHLYSDKKTKTFFNNTNMFGKKKSIRYVLNSKG